MSSTTGIQPLPPAVGHDPLGRAMTEEQKLRLREQPDPPVAEAAAQDRLRDRRRESAPRRAPPDPAARVPDAQADGAAHAPPGSIIDSYA